MEHGQRQEEQELEKLTAELHLTKQPTDEAGKVAALSQSRAEAAEGASDPPGRGTIPNYHKSDPMTSTWQNIKGSNLPRTDKGQPLQRPSPIRLKAVDLPIFSGEDKEDYKPWKAAFMSIVDGLEIPVDEMLRLQNSLTCRKGPSNRERPGISIHAYERAKANS